MEKADILCLLKKITNDENIKIDESMSKHTYFKIGGPADFLVEPDNKDELRKIVVELDKNKVPFFIMGNGTNLLVRDKGIRGVVIKLADKFNSINVDGEVIKAEAGALLSKIAIVALNNELTGMEFASGIPGSIGGATVMNAGAYSGEMKDIVIKTEFIDKAGEITCVEGSAHEFDYRTSVMQKEGEIVTSVYLKLKKGDKTKIKSQMDEYAKQRREKQPLSMPSAGSVFKRPTGFFAGKLIEDSGLKGYKIGGAQVSEKHCGFIVNTGNATAKDVIDLIHAVQKKVKEEFNVNLETEVKVVGEE